MKYFRTINATEMRGINRTAILEAVRRSGTTSRMAISRQLDITMPTVMRIVDELIDEKLVREIGIKEKSGGRKRSLIELNSSEHLCLGLDLGGTKFHGAVVNLGGEILFEKTLPTDHHKGEACYAQVLELIQLLLENALSSGKHIMGIGVGAPGVTDHSNGIIDWAPSLEWRKFPLKERLANHFHMPVIVDNDVNLSALGEMWFGVGREANNMVLINIGTGIGAGVVINGVLYRGTHEMAGEIGYLITEREDLNKDYPTFGALELRAAGTGIAMRARKILGSMNGKQIEISAEDVFKACRSGEKWAQELVDETIDYLAITMAAVITFFDPEVIALGGGVAQSGDLLIDPIIKKLKGKVPLVPPMISSSLMHRSAVLGAMINLLHNTSDFFMVQKIT